MKHPTVFCGVSCGSVILAELISLLNIAGVLLVGSVVFVLHSTFVACLALILATHISELFLVISGVSFRLSSLGFGKYFCSSQRFFQVHALSKMSFPGMFKLLDRAFW